VSESSSSTDTNGSPSEDSISIDFDEIDQMQLSDENPESVQDVELDEEAVGITDQDLMGVVSSSDSEADIDLDGLS
jgi:hypothetical protein